MFKIGTVVKIEKMMTHSEREYPRAAEYLDGVGVIVAINKKNQYVVHFDRGDCGTIIDADDPVTKNEEQDVDKVKLEHITYNIDPKTGKYVENLYNLMCFTSLEDYKKMTGLDATKQTWRFYSDEDSELMDKIRESVLAGKGIPDDLIEAQCNKEIKN